MVPDPVVALETLISLGFHRLLTSGCDTSALEGLPLIKRLIDQVSQILQRSRKEPSQDFESETMFNFKSKRKTLTAVVKHILTLKSYAL